jgi:2-iminobutanoate/2-iminopropanoate deaminase
MKNGIISTALPSPAGAYSHVVECGGVVFTSGFGPQEPATGEVPEGIEAQTKQAIRNVESALQEFGLTLADVVKTTVHLERLDRDVATYNAVYAEMFPAPYPARTTVGSTLAGILVEIDAVAMRKN